MLPDKTDCYEMRARRYEMGARPGSRENEDNGRRGIPLRYIHIFCRIPTNDEEWRDSKKINNLCVLEKDVFVYFVVDKRQY